uniref:Sodium-coupled monocarboxylate transporter 1 n=1 Tax=Steinernema glaseri TaxID=37863 RepID=A0A1I7Y9H2_9BILA
MILDLTTTISFMLVACRMAMAPLYTAKECFRLQDLFFRVNKTVNSPLKPMDQEGCAMTTADPKTTYSLGYVDYAVFAAFMCISVGVGAYYAVIGKFRTKKAKDGPKSATEDYLLGGRKMPFVPIALSLMATSLSGVTLLGTPAEIFDHGALWMLNYWVAPFSAVLAALIFLPIFYHLNTTSIYEYLELRFHSTLLRRLCAGAFIFNTLVFMGVVIYAPAVALSGVTDMQTWWLILLVGVTSTLYTTFGGLKAVVWTDTLQAGVMYVGIGFILVKGTIDAGGFAHIWEIAVESGRLETFLRFDLNPAQYMNVWALFFSSSLMWLNFYGLDQMAVQRYCSVPSLKEARQVIWLTIPFTTILTTLACFIGLLVLAYFYDSNPMETGEISTYDQLVVLFAVKVSGPYPGLSGLFLACIFATTLSTVSSGYNSMAAVVYNDFLRPCFNDKLPQDKALIFSKITVFLGGFFSTCIAFAAGPLGGIIYASVGLTSATYGPVVGLFFLGIFARKVSTRAATVSFFTAMVTCVSLFVFSVTEMPYIDYHMPTKNTVNATDLHYGRPDAPYLSRISPFFYGIIGFSLMVVPSLALSYFWPPKEEKFSSSRRHSLTWKGRPKTEVIRYSAVEPLEVLSSAKMEEVVPLRVVA